MPSGKACIPSQRTCVRLLTVCARATCDRIRRELGVDDLLCRYRDGDGLPPGEGAFGICAFWEVECRELRGEHAYAGRQFENLIGLANDVGLFAEEIDPASQTLLGNFPQGLTHVGLVNAAFSLQERPGQ